MGSNFFVKVVIIRKALCQIGRGLFLAIKI